MNSQSTFKLAPLTLAIAAALYPVQVVMAQEEKDDLVLEEVLVTATMRETSLQVVPQSITAFTSEEIKSRNLQTLDDLVAALPSLGLVSSQPGRNDLVYRGVSSGSGEYYTDTQVAVYLDDSSISLISQQPWPHFVDIDHVESLPGPQGTLYGSASQTGTTRIITRKPTTEGVQGEAFAEVSSTKGGDMSYELNGMINIPIGDSFAIRAVAYRVDNGGWIDNVPYSAYRGPTEDGPQFDPTNADVVDDNINTQVLNGGRIAALWELSDDLTASLAIITEDSVSKGTWNSDPYFGDFEIVRFFDEYNEDNWTNIAFTIDADLGFASFLSVTSIFDRHIQYEWDRMAYEQYKDSAYGYYSGFVLYNTQYTFGTTFNDQNQERFSQEFRFTSQSDSRFQWMLGLYYEDLHDDWYFGADNPYLMETIAWPYAQYWAGYYNYYGYPVEYPMAPTTVGYSETLDRDNEQISIFGEISYDIGDNWRIIGGLRWFEYDRYNSIQNQFPEGLPPWGTMATDGVTVGEGKTGDTLFKGSIQYQISDNKMIYALFSQGFRLGGFNSLRSANTGLVPLEYDPDTIDNFEIGLKSQWMKNRLLLNVTAFRMEWNDYQQNYGGIDGQWWLSGNFNATDARITGVEMDSQLLITENLSVNLNLFWADPEWSEDYYYPWQDLEDDPDQAPGIYKGMALSTSPEWKGSAALFWTIPGLFGTEDVFINYTFSFQEEMWDSLSSSRDEDPDGLIPSWNVSTLQIGAHLRNDWMVNLVIRNLFDQKAISWLDNGGNYASDWFEVDWNRNIRTYNRPRNIGIQVRKNWN